jgi:hypothetical protein
VDCEVDRQHKKELSKTMVDSARASTNLAVLQRQDDKVIEVLFNAAHVVLYQFSMDDQQWVCPSSSSSCSSSCSYTHDYCCIILLL